MPDVKNSRSRGRPRAFDRDAALELAMGVFWAEGYGHASIPLLTDAMGISAQSLYAAFGSKEELYRETVERYRTSVGGFITRAMEEEKEVLAAMERLLREAAVAFTCTAATPGCMVTMAPSGTEESGLVAYGRHLRADALQKVTDRLRQGIDEGQLRTDVSCDAWARYIISVLQGLSVQARDMASKDELLAAVSVVVQSLQFLKL